LDLACGSFLLTSSLREEIIMLNSETKSALNEMRKELEEIERQKAREFGKAKGRMIDQTELCYKQYSPPQVTNVKS